MTTDYGPRTTGHWPPKEFDLTADFLSNLDMLPALLLSLVFQSPTVLQSMADGLPVLGKLQFPPGQESALIQVLLEDDNGQVVDRAESSPNGEFRFNGVKLGRYWLVIEGEKFQNVRQRLEIDVRAFAMVNVSIRLYPLTVRTNPDDDGTVSLDELRRKIPINALKEYEKALAEMRKGKTREAMSLLEKSIKLAPDFSDAHLQLGLQRQREGDRVQAIASLEKAVGLNPTSRLGQSWLGRLYFEMDQFDKALATLNAALKLIPVSAETHFYLGSAHYKLNALPEAEQHLLRALAISPETMGKAHLQLYNVYMKSRQGEKGLDQLDAWLRDFPNEENRVAIQEQADRLRRMLRR